jgi:hypothetical protein
MRVSDMALIIWEQTNGEREKFDPIARPKLRNISIAYEQHNLVNVLGFQNQNVALDLIEQ